MMGWISIAKTLSGDIRRALFVSVCLRCNQALILKAWGDLEGAMKLHKEEERICKELGNKKGLAISLINQASLLSEDMGKPSDAVSLAEEAYRIAIEHGLAALAQQIKPIVDKIKKARA